MLSLNPGWRKDDGVPKYIIYMQAHPTKKDDKNSVGLMYCSYVANWEDRSCDDPEKIKKVCSMPGPIFYV